MTDDSNRDFSGAVNQQRAMMRGDGCTAGNPMSDLIDRDSVLLALAIIMLPEQHELLDRVENAILALPTPAQAAPRCARCGSSGDTYVLCSGCGMPASPPYPVEAVLRECASRCRYDGDLFHDQGNIERRDASWKAAEMAADALSLVSSTDRAAPPSVALEGEKP